MFWYKMAPENDKKAYRFLPWVILVPIQFSIFNLLSFHESVSPSGEAKAEVILTLCVVEAGAVRGSFSISSSSPLCVAKAVRFSPLLCVAEAVRGSPTSCMAEAGAVRGSFSSKSVTQKIPNTCLYYQHIKKK